jgi:catechol 1,2-dioxygenase/hydroxyquinol 1,2-dioxygenase
MLKWLFGDKTNGTAGAGSGAANGAATSAPGQKPRPEVLHLTPETVTQAVFEQMATTTDPRMREIMEAAVMHLHQFARDTKLTPAEWLYGIDFLTRVGKMCTPDRQEFILMSDTLGMSALVNLMHDKTAMEVATDTSLLGPFFRENAPRMNPGDQIAKDTSAGEVAMYGKVTDAHGKPLANARIDIWQTASNGLYDIQSDPSGAMDCRGYFLTDADGNYLMRTVSPIDYSIPMDGPVGEMVRAQRRHGMRPAHIHLLISAPDHRELVTALYLSTSKYLATDVVFGSSSEDLVAEVIENDPNCPIKGMLAVRYDFRLSRMSEADRRSGRVGSDPSKVGATA